MSAGHVVPEEWSAMDSVTVRKCGLKSTFVELFKQIILWGEILSFDHQGIAQLFNMDRRSCWEEERGLRPSASSELLVPHAKF